MYEFDINLFALALGAQLGFKNGRVLTRNITKKIHLALRSVPIFTWIAGTKKRPGHVWGAAFFLDFFAPSGSSEMLKCILSAQARSKRKSRSCDGLTFAKTKPQKNHTSDFPVCFD